MQEVSTTEISMTHLRDWLGWYNGCLAINTDCQKQTLARVRLYPQSAVRYHYICSVITISPRASAAEAARISATC